jgi:DNA segregation ATPase FtsK/SpoIIIE, S-DNA-T family
VGQSDERTLTLLSVALISLAAQYPGKSRASSCSTARRRDLPQREFLERVLQAVPQKVRRIGNGNLDEAMSRLAEELKQRTADEPASPETFILVQGLQNFKKLRQEDEFSFSSTEAGAAANPAAVLLDLLSEGPARGISCHRCLRHLQQRDPFPGAKDLE